MQSCHIEIVFLRTYIQSCLYKKIFKIVWIHLFGWDAIYLCNVVVFFVFLVSCPAKLHINVIQHAGIANMVAMTNTTSRFVPRESESRKTRTQKRLWNAQRTDPPVHLPSVWNVQHSSTTTPSEVSGHWPAILTWSVDWHDCWWQQTQYGPWKCCVSSHQPGVNV